MTATATDTPTEAVAAWLTPQRFLLLVGIPIGLAFAILTPAWAGYDEGTHFARSYDIADGQLFPQATPSGTGTMMPASFRSDLDLVTNSIRGGAEATDLSTVRELLDSDPEGDRSYFEDTRATNAATPVPYAPSALGMVVPVALDTPLVITLWAGRLASFAVYIAVAWLAVGIATSFRWTLALAALIPLNVALAASVSPDGLTIAATLLIVAVWTRVEDGELTARAAIVEVGVAGLLLVLVKPPYFLALALFPALWLIRRRDLVARYAAATATALLGAGLFVALGPGGGDYEPTTRTLADTIQYQPDVQRSRLLGDPFGFLWASTRTFFADFDDYVQEWFRQLNFFKTELPVAAAWIALGVIIVAALRLDAADYQRLRGWLRGTHVAFVVGMILVIFASSFIYFDDSTDYARINRQMYRYVLPLAPMAMVGLLPRGTWILEPLTRRLRSETAIGIATAAIGTVALFGVLTWVWLLDGAALWE